MLPVALVSQIHKMPVHQREPVFPAWHRLLRFWVDHVERKLLKLSEAAFWDDLFKSECFDLLVRAENMNREDDVAVHYCGIDAASFEVDALLKTALRII